MKEFTHKLAAESLVLVSDVEASFAPLETQTPIGMEDYIAYFGATYVNGVPARGRRRALAPRHDVHLRNHYDSTIEGQGKAKNVLEGWHTRFDMLMGKHLYAFSKEILKEKGDIEIAMVELSLGKKIKVAPRKKSLDVQKKLRRIVQNYEDYSILEYMKAVGYRLLLF